MLHTYSHAAHIVIRLRTLDADLKIASSWAYIVVKYWSKSILTWVCERACMCLYMYFRLCVFALTTLHLKGHMTADAYYHHVAGYSALSTMLT